MKDDAFTFEADPLSFRDDEGGESDLEGSRTGATAATAPADPSVPPGSPAVLREPDPTRASAVSRLVAFALDLAVLSGMEAVLVWVASSAFLSAERLLGHPPADAGAVVEALAAAGSAALAVGYFVVLQAGAGQTLGKAALRIRVARPDGTPLGLGRSALRFAGYFLSALPLGLGFLGALGPRRRTLHDVLADSVVVRTQATGDAP